MSNAKPRTDGGATATARLRRTIDQLTAEDIGLYVVLTLAAAFYLVPIESGLVTSFKTGTAIIETAPFAPPGPSGFTLEKWQTATDTLLRGMGNSLLYAVPATVISAFRRERHGVRPDDPNLEEVVQGSGTHAHRRRDLHPVSGVLVPLTQFWSQWVQLGDALSFVWALGIDDDYVGIIELVITHVAYGLPICTLLFRTYYKTMSDEMIESARLDGATLRRVYRRIVLPLSGPMFAVVLIYQFTQIWNDLLFTLVIVSTESSPAAPVVLILAGLGSSLEGQDFALRMAGAFFAALPTLAVYILFGEEFAEGVAA